MSSIPRFILRWGLISALALGGATLLIGPERVAAGLSCVRAKAQSVVDRAVDSPVALRRQLQDLADEYPDRIATVRGEIAEVDHQIAQFERDSEIATRVVSLTSDDLGELKTLITRAEGTEGHPVYVRFEGRRFALDQAYGEAKRINSVRINYNDRLQTNQQQLALLNQQKARLAEIQTKLEDEFSTFETQMWQLDRQIDAIERNDRLIDMTKQLQATLETYDKWGKVGNLKQLESKLAQLKTVQEAQLEYLAKQGVTQDYEKRAKYELDTENAPAEASPFDEIETDPKANEPSDSFAWLGPVIVD
jgi:phage shock protein A